MTIKNIIEINGQKYDFEELVPEKRKELANILNEKSLSTLNYIQDKTA